MGSRTRSVQEAPWVALTVSMGPPWGEDIHFGRESVRNHRNLHGSPPNPGVEGFLDENRMVGGFRPFEDPEEFWEVNLREKPAHLAGGVSDPPP